MLKNFSIKKGVIAGIILVAVLAALGYFWIWPRQNQETIQETDLIGGLIPALNIPNMNIAIPADFESLEPNQQERFRAKDVRINAPTINLP